MELGVIKSVTAVNFPTFVVVVVVVHHTIPIPIPIKCNVLYYPQNLTIYKSKRIFFFTQTKMQKKNFNEIMKSE